MRNEIRYAVRGLLRDRVFALMIVLSLAVGIGANTAIFSLINGVLLRPPDFPHPERLVALAQWAPKLLKAYPALPVNIAIYGEWRKRVASFEQVGIARKQLAESGMTMFASGPTADDRSRRRISLRDFYVRRVFRIFPAFYTYAAVMAALTIAGVIAVSGSDFANGMRIQSGDCFELEVRQVS